MKNIKLTILFTLSVFLVLTLTIKGVWGNPDPETINRDLKGEAMPFELSPERGRFALLSSIVDYNSLNFPTEVARYVVPDLGFHNGKYVSLFPPGVSYLAIPFYLLGKYFNLGQVFAFSVISVFATLNVFLILKIVEIITKNWYAGAVAGLSFIFGTSALSYAGTLYQHHVTSFFILTGLYLLFNKTEKYSAFLMGLLVGISIFVEYNNAVFIIPILIGLIIRHIDLKVKNNKVLVSLNNYLFLGLIGFIIGIAPNFYYSYKAYGDPFKLAGTVQSVDQVIINKDSGLAELPKDLGGEETALGFFNVNMIPQSMSVLLTSSDRGALWFSPIILLSLLGIRSLYKKRQFEAVTLLATILLILLLYGMWGDPWGGWAFGTRYLIPLFALTAILIGEAVSLYSKKAWFNILFVILFYYSLIVNTAGALTTSQIPPTKESESLRYPHPTFIYNYGLILEGKSSSFVYNNLFKNYISLSEYFWIMFTIVSIGLAIPLYKSQKV